MGSSLRRRRNSTRRRVLTLTRIVGEAFLRAAPAIEANVARRSTLYEKFVISTPRTSARLYG